MVSTSRPSSAAAARRPNSLRRQSLRKMNLRRRCKEEVEKEEEAPETTGAPAPAPGLVSKPEETKVAEISSSSSEGNYNDNGNDNDNSNDNDNDNDEETSSSSEDLSEPNLDLVLEEDEDFKLSKQCRVKMRRLPWSPDADPGAAPVPVSSPVPVPGRFPAKCHICGNSVHGRHLYYGAQSCHSCRAFFKRASLNQKYQKFSCRFDRDCQVDSRSWKSCQWCRFQKCLQAGMKPPTSFATYNKRTTSKEPGNDTRQPIRKQPEHSSTLLARKSDLESSLAPRGFMECTYQVPEQISANQYLVAPAAQLYQRVSEPAPSNHHHHHHHNHHQQHHNHQHNYQHHHQCRTETLTASLLASTMRDYHVATTEYLDALDCTDQYVQTACGCGDAAVNANHAGSDSYGSYGKEGHEQDQRHPAERREYYHQAASYYQQRRYFAGY